MTYLDRFVIGIVSSLAAVAWYVTPQEIVSRLLIVPGALTSVLFPRLSEIYAGGQPREAAWQLERLALLALYLSLFPVTLLLGAFAGTVLDLWIGPEFAREGASAMLVLCAGVLVNSLAQVPFASVQARGGARSTALLHLAELPLSVAAVWLMTLHWGVTGAALAWTLRIVLDFAVLQMIARPESGVAGRRGGDRSAAVVAVLTAASFACAALGPGAARLPVSLAIGALAWGLAASRLRTQPEVRAGFAGLRTRMRR
jgi:O-antigen/teichoic acid export membrane protein